VGRGGLSVKHMGFKPGAIGNTFGEHVENLIGTHWELENNIEGTCWEQKKNDKKSSLPPPPPPQV